MVTDSGCITARIVRPVEISGSIYAMIANGELPHPVYVKKYKNGAREIDSHMVAGGESRQVWSYVDLFPPGLFMNVQFRFCAHMK